MEQCPVTPGLDCAEIKEEEVVRISRLGKGPKTKVSELFGLFTRCFDRRALAFGLVQFKRMDQGGQELTMCI